MSFRRVSVAATPTPSERYTSNRHLRQADQVLKLEGDGLKRPPALPEDLVWIENPEDIEAPAHSADASFFGRSRRRESVFRFHPGRLLSNTKILEETEKEAYAESDIRPWDEPSVYQDAGIGPGRRKNVIRQATFPIEIDRSRSQFAAPQLNRSWRINSGHRQSKALSSGLLSQPAYTLSEGLAPAAEMSVAFTAGLISQRLADWVKRKHLHVFDYKIEDERWPHCVPNSFSTAANLERHLETQNRDGDYARVIHVRNSDAAFKTLDRVYAITNSNSNIGEHSFSDWMQAENSNSRQTSNMTVRFRPAFDHKRSIICMAFGIDFGSFETRPSTARPSSKKKTKHQPPPFKRRRIACYMQRHPFAIPGSDTIRFSSLNQHQHYPFTSHDTLIICESSSDAASELMDTNSILVPCDIPGAPFIGSTAIIASVTRHVCEEISRHWDKEMTIFASQFAELEDLIYDRPANIDLAHSAWGWSQRLHQALKLVHRHLKTIQAFQIDFCQFAELESECEWLDDILSNLKNVGETIKVDFIEPLEHMIDLMYKSVAIDDTRRSFELNASLWRLSWVTFIFLPMTFLVGFFGMNVAIFQQYPSVGWYFVSLIPLFGIVFVCWYAFHKYGQEGHQFLTNARTSKTVREQEQLPQYWEQPHSL